MSYAPYEQNIDLPVRYPDNVQRWMPTLEQPYPMNFTQAQSPKNQVVVYYQGKPYTQALSTNTGPIMYPVRESTLCPKNGWERKHTIYPRRNGAIVYPTTHSIPGPYLQSYIALPKKMYPY